MIRVLLSLVLRLLQCRDELLESVPILPFSGVWKKLCSLPVWAYTVLMWLCWFWMSLALLGSPLDQVKGNTQIVDSWGAIERVALWQNAISWLIPNFEWSRDAISWSIRVSFALLFLLQAAAFFKARNQPDTRIWPWLAGPVGAYVIMMFFMPPANSDVFYYSMSASLAAENINPYAHTLMDFPENPLFQYNHWIDIGSVYGPVWTWTGKMILEITGPDPILAITGYRIFMSLVSLALVGVTYQMAKLLTDQRAYAVAAAVLVAWQPNMVFETVGQVHNDAFVILLALAGLLLVFAGGMRALRGGMVLAALSSATKFVTLPILGLLVLQRVKLALEDTEHRAKHIRDLIIDALAIVLVYFLTFALFWVGTDTIREMLAEPSRLFAHPFWRLIEWMVGTIGGHTATTFSNTIIRGLMMMITFVVFAWAALRTMGWYQKPHVVFKNVSERVHFPNAHSFLFTILIVELVLSLIPANAHPWYQVWSVPFVAFWTIYTTSDRRSKLAGLYITLIAMFTIVYHTRIMS